MSVYHKFNPHGLVLTLGDESQLLTQSLASIEFLDELYPNPPLLPSTPTDRAFVRSVTLQVACEIHPINNLRVIFSR